MPSKIPSISAAMVMLVTVAPTQCLDTAGGTAVTLSSTQSPTTIDDEGRSVPLPLGFAFPIGGSTFTHVVVESNGVAYLTNGGPAVGATVFGLADMSGGAGASPRIAAFWTDLEGFNAGAAWRITVDGSVPGLFKINWINVNEYSEVGQFTVQAVLESSGIVDVTSSPGLSLVGIDATVGISIGNGQSVIGSDLSAGPASTIPALFEIFPPGAIDLAGSTTRFIPVGAGYVAARSCGGPATHTAYGLGCNNMTLSASPAPISTPTSGTAVVYAIGNVPLFAPGSGLYVALAVLSLGPIPAPGIGLAALGGPGCFGLVQSLDLTLAVVGTTPNQTTSFLLPAGVPAGLMFYAQAAALIAPNGLATSNGIASQVQPY